MMPHSLLEKKNSVSFWANLASYRNPLKLEVFLIFENVLHAEPDRCFACTLLIKYMTYCINVKLVPRARHSKIIKLMITFYHRPNGNADQ
jgi:hypothetical protein